MSRTRVRILGRALADLEEIGAYLDIEAPRARTRILEALLTAIASLGSQPRREPVARDPILAERGFRSVRSERYVVFYKLDRSTVRVYRVLHERRSWAPLLGPRA